MCLLVRAVVGLSTPFRDMFSADRYHADASSNSAELKASVPLARSGSPLLLLFPMPSLVRRAICIRLGQFFAACGNFCLRCGRSCEPADDTNYEQDEEQEQEQETQLEEEGDKVLNSTKPPPLQSPPKTSSGVSPRKVQKSTRLHSPHQNDHAPA